MFRELKSNSYDYIERLVQGRLCGEVYYEDTLEIPVENKNSPVKLYFNRNEINEQQKQYFVKECGSKRRRRI